MKYREILLGRIQGGWSCEITFTVTTARQFSDEQHDVHETASTWYGALWGAWRAVRAIVREVGAKRGERKACGWS